MKKKSANIIATIAVVILVLVVGIAVVGIAAMLKVLSNTTGW